MAVRFFLGVGEAAIAPGFTLLTGMFFKREEQPIRQVFRSEPTKDSLTRSRQSAWFFGNCIAALIGGLIAYGIGNINTSAIAHWKLLFLILGAITSAYGLVLFVLLPDSPAKAMFLKPNERVIAVQRIMKDKTGVMDTGVFKWSQAVDALKDPQMWFLVLNSFTSNLANGGLTSVSNWRLVFRGLHSFSI